MPIRTLAVLPLALAVVGLAACGAEATVSSEDVAAAAEDALEEQIGSRPEIDCGELNLTVHVDRRTYCTLTDDATGSEYEVTITVTSIQGDQFEFDVQVADTPRD